MAMGAPRYSRTTLWPSFTPNFSMSSEERSKTIGMLHSVPSGSANLSSVASTSCRPMKPDSGVKKP